MLTLLLNTKHRGLAGGASVGAPVVSVGVTVPSTAGGGTGSVRHWGAGYDYDDPIVVAVREEIKVLEVERQELTVADTAMLSAINERLRYLRKLLQDRKRLFMEAESAYNYQARMELENKIKIKKKRDKRMRRAQMIARMLN